MSQSDDQRGRVFQHLPFVFSLLGSVIVWLVTLLGREQAFSSLQSGAITVFIAISLVTILFLVVPPAIFRAQRVIANFKIKKCERDVVSRLNTLLDYLNDLFELYRPDSFRQHVEDLYAGSKENPAIRSKLDIIRGKLRMLDGWKVLLGQSLQKPGNIDHKYGFQNTIDYVNSFHRSWGDVIREFKAVGSNSETVTVRNTESARLVQDKYNDYMNRLEVILRDARKIHSEEPFGAYPRL